MSREAEGVRKAMRQNIFGVALCAMLFTLSLIRLFRDSVLKPVSDLRLLMSGLRALVVALCSLLLAPCSPAQAQHPVKVHRIGFLSYYPASDPHSGVRLDGLRQGLRELGYVEGKNIIIEYRYGQGKFEQLLPLAQELVHLNVEVLLVSNDLTARAAKQATGTIPIVMVSSGNPIGVGVIASLARPGGNVTGLTSYTAELLGKRLELLKEVVPKVSRFAFLHTDATGDASASRDAFEQTQDAAKALGVQFRLLEVNDANPDFEGAFRVMTKERIGGLITSPAPRITLHRKRILALTDQNRLPAIHPEQQWTNEGGLMSYGANTVDQYRRAAVYVDKILKGARPADLPVERPIKFELVINLKIAKQIGVTIPSHVLLRADRVIR